jgi:DsbC/DsbD-like thiol-disulfide interchange protein
MIRRSLLLLLGITILAPAAHAQGSASVVKVSPGEQVYKVRKGGTAQVKVLLEIDSGYHINSNRPTDKNLIATALTLDRTDGISAASVVYPRAKQRKFQFSPKPLSVYEGRVELRFGLRALASAQAGRRTLKGKLRVQACNEEACLRPQNVNVEIPIEVL